jgi:hypothetical protein
MNLADIEEYFSGDNNRYLSPEETAAFIAYLLLNSQQGEISASQIINEIRSGGYYNISFSVLYKALRFFQDNGYCLTKLNRKSFESGKRTGRPEKLYCLSNDRNALRVLQHIGGFCMTLRPRSGLCRQLERLGAEDEASLERA